MEKLKLNDGNEMPAVGIGTFLMEPDVAEQAVVDALKNGYRLIDTANAYVNEKAVGRGIKKSGVPREEIFITTKLWPTVYEDENAIDKTLERLGVDYIDLLLLHQPCGNYKYAYKMMEKAVKEGKVKSIGLSNFEEQIDNVLEFAEIKPSVIQVEAHPYFPQNELKEKLKDIGTRLMAWYPLGHGDPTLREQEVFTKLAEKYNKSNVQIILRWHVQSGNIVIPGATKEDHIKANIDIFDFELTDDEMQEIAKIDQNKRYYIPDSQVVASYATMHPPIDEQK